jgi:hypothetical protein
MSELKQGTMMCGCGNNGVKTDKQLFYQEMKK